MNELLRVAESVEIGPGPLAAIVDRAARVLLIDVGFFPKFLIVESLVSSALKLGIIPERIFNSYMIFDTYHEILIFRIISFSSRTAKSFGFGRATGTPKWSLSLSPRLKPN